VRVRVERVFVVDRNRAPRDAAKVVLAEGDSAMTDAKAVAAEKVAAEIAKLP